MFDLSIYSIYLRAESVMVKYNNKLNLLGCLDDIRKHKQIKSPITNVAISLSHLWSQYGVGLSVTIINSLGANMASADS